MSANANHIQHTGRIEFNAIDPGWKYPLHPPGMINNMTWPPTVSKAEYDALMTKYVALLERVAGAKL